MPFVGSSPRKIGARHRRAWRRSTRFTATLLGVALVAGAATTASALRQNGFLLNGTGNAASFTNPVTLILYPSGEEAAAKTLDHWVLGAAKLEASTSVPAGVVHLILGDSFAGTVASGNGS